MHPAGLKPKDLIGMPWRLALALQEDGWWLRQDIIWSKPNPMPESVTDRCTKAHEYLFLLTKSAQYFYDAEAIKENVVPSQVGRVRSDAVGGTSHEERGQHSAGGVYVTGKNGKNAFRGQGSNRDGANGPANRDGRDMSMVGVGSTRNKRSVWEIATEAFPEAHFATFPTKLVEPCILAGTSEMGCCNVCGAPSERVTAPSEAYAKHLGKGVHDHRDDLGTGMSFRDAPRVNAEYVTTGWKPTCKCGAACEADDGIAPCVVLDPFSGSGTTGVVALRLGREYVGIELNPEYVAMSERRLKNYWRKPQPKAKGTTAEHAPLFAQAEVSA
jgi:DNA modification methylase